MAAQARRKLQVGYRDVADQVTRRTLRPLGCFYWGRVWTLAAWCETRQAFRNFRLDRIDSAMVMDGPTGQFQDESGKTLADYLRTVVPPHIHAKWSNEV